MKHVLFDIHYPIFGGPHNQALQLAEPLRRRGWELHVLLPEGGNAAKRLREANVQVIEERLRRLRFHPDPRLHLQFLGGLNKEISLIRRLIRERQIELVMIAGLYTVQTAIAARLEQVPVVWQILDTLTPNVVRRIMIPVVARLADSVMTTGMEVARQYPGAIELLRDRLVPYYPPVDTSKFRPNVGAREVARRELGVPETAMLIGTVGNLNRTKGHQHLIEAARLILDSDPNVYVRVLGTFTPTHATYEAMLQSLIRDMDLSHNGQVTIMDPKGRVSDLMPAFDIFVSTSIPRSEGIPTTILEAMSAGLPVVATKVGGVAEVVEDGVSGFVVPPLDHKNFAEVTMTLLRDPDMRTRMASRARSLAVEHYDLERSAEAHVRAFEVAVTHHGKKIGDA